MMRRLIFIGVLLLVASIAATLWYAAALRPTGAPQTSIVVKDGQRTDQIAKELKAKNLIRSPFAFKLHVRFDSLASKFKSGRYALAGDKSTPAIAAALTEGSQDTTRFTIKEGVTQRQIANLLGDQEIVNKQEFEDLRAANFPQYDFLQRLPGKASLEGFLFPETYTIPPPGTSTKDVATIMLDQFDQELTPDMREQIQKNGRTIYETVIIASMVEAEVRTDKDRKLVAGIMYKRLREGIRLDIDATTRYGLNKPTGALTQQDLDSDSPYNTRKVKGLPPGPIGNPGLSSLMAAIYPEDSEYLFYLSAPDGTTYFAKTNEEHERNKSEHLR